MKRIFTLLLGLIAFAATTKAQAVLWLDYCQGQYNTTQYAIAQAGEVEMAIHLTHEQLAGVAGNEVSQLAMAFPTTHPTSMKMWLRADRNGENLREISVSQIASKWNTYTLDNPLPLTGEEQDLWVGATFTQKYTSNKYISMAGTTSAEGCYYRVDGGEWQSEAGKDVGSFCIRMGITGPNVPHHDLSISDITTAENTYGIGENIAFNLRVNNHGADDAVNPIVRCSINGKVIASNPLTATIRGGEYADATVKVPTTSITNPGIATFGFEVLWADNEPDTHPENNTGAINVGLALALHDIALENVRTAARIVKLGSNVNISGTIRNNNFAVLRNAQIAYSINGGEPTKKAISCTLKTGESHDFSFSIPTKTVTDDGNATIDLELLWRDGSEDVLPADNRAQLTVRLTSSEPNRRMVVEEGTGTWCGWCIRGIVGMHDMAAKYPDQFIGIAVHANDEFQNATYIQLLAKLGVNGYPTCFINREPTQLDPQFSTMENYLKSMQQYSEFDIDCTAELSANKFNMSATVKPIVDIDKSDYRVVFAITEDYLPAMQANYYAGGGSGVMGGFESKPSNVKVDLMDVARAILPNAEGNSSVALPSVMEAGREYVVSYTANASDVRFENLDNLNVIALLLDGTTGQIANAAKFEQRLVGINSVIAPTATDAPAYNLAGQPASRQQHGLVIEGGRKSIR